MVNETPFLDINLIVEELEDKPFVVACVPAFDEEKTIGRVVLLAQRYADKVIVCDDGSRDMTAEIAEGRHEDIYIGRVWLICGCFNE